MFELIAPNSFADTSTDSTHEDHYAVPDTRLRSSVIPLDSRPYLGPPGPSYVAQSYYDDSRLYNREIRNKSQKLSCEFDDEKATRTFTKHISFEPPIMKTAPSELKQVTFQRSPKPVFGNSFKQLSLIFILTLFFFHQQFSL